MQINYTMSPRTKINKRHDEIEWLYYGTLICPLEELGHLVLNPHILNQQKMIHAFPYSYKFHRLTSQERNINNATAIPSNPRQENTSVFHNFVYGMYAVVYEHKTIWIKQGSLMHDILANTKSREGQCICRLTPINQKSLCDSTISCVLKKNNLLCHKKQSTMWAAYPFHISIKMWFICS